jgi:hypothetical protein
MTRTVKFGRECEGFRMPARRDDLACTGAGVRKPPREETARKGTQGRAAGVMEI